MKAIFFFNLSNTQKNKTCSTYVFLHIDKKSVLFKKNKKPNNSLKIYPKLQAFGSNHLTFSFILFFVKRISVLR